MPSIIGQTKAAFKRDRQRRSGFPLFRSKSARKALCVAGDYIAVVMLEGVAAIEQRGYDRLGETGATSSICMNGGRGHDQRGMDKNMAKLALIGAMTAGAI